MKKVFTLILLSIFLVSCQNDVAFNTPAFQGRKDNFMWRADISNAVYNPADSTLVLSGFKGFEVVRITAYPIIIVGNGATSFFQNATFDLRNNPNVTAQYSYVNNGQMLFYSTDVEDEATGEFVLQNAVAQKPGTVSGLFRFDAPYIGDVPGSPERVNFQEGVIYEVPITFAP